MRSAVLAVMPLFAALLAVPAWKSVWGLAIRIAVEAGALPRCEIHEVLMEGGKDLVEAYKLGNARYTDGKLSEFFGDRMEMTDAIQSAVQEHAADECYACAKNAAE
jgi:hypothetical protein